MSLFNANDAVCVGCLSTNRKLSILQNPTLFYYLLGRPTVEKALGGSVPACWECAALLRRINQFQIQVKNAGIILEKCMERSVKGSFSKLGIHQNYDYDFIIEESLPPDDEIKRVNIRIEKLEEQIQITKPVRSSKRIKEKHIETIVVANPHIDEVRTKEESVVADGLFNLAQTETFEDSRESEEVEQTGGIIVEFEELNEKIDEQNDGYNEAYDFDDDLEADNISFKSHQITKPGEGSKRLKEKQIETILIANPHIDEVRIKEESLVADGLFNLARTETFEDSRESEEVEQTEGIIVEFEELNEKIDEQNDGYNEAYDFDDDLEADNISFKSHQITKPGEGSKRLKEKQIETIVIANPHIDEVRIKEESVVADGLFNLARTETFEDSRESEEVEQTGGIIVEFEELNEKIDEQNDGYNEAYDFDDDLEADNISFKSHQITKPGEGSKRLKEKQIGTIVIANPHIDEVRIKEETVVADGLLTLAPRETFEYSRECEEVEQTEGITVEFEELNEKIDEENDGYNAAYDFDDERTIPLVAENISFKSDQITKPVRSSKRLKEKEIETIVIANPHIVEFRTKEENVIADGLLNLDQQETFEDSRKSEEVEKTEEIIEEFEELNDKKDNNGEIETASNNINRLRNGQFKHKNLGPEIPKKKPERWGNVSYKKIFIKHPETLTYFTEVEPHENQKKEFFGNENPDPENPWRCLPCMVAFSSKRRLYGHHILKHDLEHSHRSWFYFKPKPPSRTKANLALFRCLLCRGLVQRISLQAHVEQFHKFRLHCENCDWSFWSFEDFRSHHRALHRHAVCDLCAFRGNTKTKLETHMRKVHLSATCHTCSRVFHPPDAHGRLHEHRRSTHPRAGDVPECRYCVECDRTFPTSPAYGHHLRTHKAHIMQRVSYPCSACGAACSSRSAAARACAEHSGARRPCPHCDQRFQSGSSLKRHVERAHLKLRPLKDKLCPTCGQGFASKLILKYHMRTHTQKCPHVCAHCPAAFNRPYLLKKHIARHHPDTLINS